MNNHLNEVSSRALYCYGCSKGSLKITRLRSFPCFTLPKTVLTVAERGNTQAIQLNLLPSNHASRCHLCVPSASLNSATKDTTQRGKKCKRIHWASRLRRATSVLSNSYHRLLETSPLMLLKGCERKVSLDWRINEGLSLSDCRELNEGTI